MQKNVGVVQPIKVHLRFLNCFFELFIYKYQRKCCNTWPNPQGTEHKTLLA